MSTVCKRVSTISRKLDKLVKNLRFQKVDDKFQRTLAKDLKGIRSSNKTFTCSRQNQKSKLKAQVAVSLH